MTKPKHGEYPDYFQRYVDPIPYEQLEDGLRASAEALLSTVVNLDEDQWSYAYAEGKWTIKQVMMHVIDAERVFAYRALSFARGEKQDLNSFDENSYVDSADFNSRSPESIMAEYKAIRSTTLELFKHLSENELSRKGTVNGNSFTVNSLAFITMGHDLHHKRILEERYLT